MESVIDFLIDAFFAVIVVLIIWTVVSWVFGFGGEPKPVVKAKMTSGRVIAVVFILLLIWGVGALIILPVLK